MSKLYTKPQMIKLLGGLSDALKAQQSKFPCVTPVMEAMAFASLELTGIKGSFASKVLDDMLAEPKRKKAKAEPKPVHVTYQDGEITVKDVPWGKAYYALCRIFGVAKPGKFHNKPGAEYDGTPIYKSCYDKKTKSYKLPLDKAPEVLDFFKAEGIQVHNVA
jgi:hypothetical protein